jgi:hypothetical protein
MVLWVSWCSVQDGKQRVGEVQAAIFRVQQSFVRTLVYDSFYTTSTKQFANVSDHRNNNNNNNNIMKKKKKKKLESSRKN